MITPELEARIFNAMRKPVEVSTKRVEVVRDESGRVLGEELVDFFKRPAGPWDANGTGKALTVICSWCPDSGQKHQAAVARGELVSHTICPTCLKRMESEL